MSPWPLPGGVRAGWLWGISGGGWAGSWAAFSFSPSPLESLTEKKKKQEQCLQSTLSTVPLTLWMPNRHKEPLLPWAPRDQGAAAGPASSRSPHCHFMYFFWVHTTPLRPSAVAERLSGGSLLLAGSLLPGGFVPPPRLSLLGKGQSCGAKHPALLGEVSARLGEASALPAAL